MDYQNLAILSVSVNIDKLGDPGPYYVPELLWKDFWNEGALLTLEQKINLIILLELVLSKGMG